MRRLLLLAFTLSACGGNPAASPADAADPAPADLASPMPPSDGGTPAGTALGATVLPAGVEFRVWAPHATSAEVRGDFPEKTVPMRAEAGGRFAATVASAHVGTIYTYHFHSPSGEIDRIDPRCRQLVADATACVVTDPGAYPWKTDAFKRPARESIVAYEMHIGSFAVEKGQTTGTFNEARARLAALADLGVNAIELMPVQHFGGKPNGWGYNPQLYFAPKPSYGTADELRAFIDEAHARGLAVWLDAVINHCDGWSKAPLNCFDGSCDGGSRGIYFFPPGQYASTPWGPRPSYIEPESAAMLKSIVPFWLDEVRGDGFRWDSVSNIRALDGSGTTPGGRDLLVAINATTRDKGGFSVAEDLKGWDAITKSAANGGFGFDSQWDGFGYAVSDVLVPYADDNRDIGTVEGLLKGGFAGDPFARLLFTENHDTVGNGGARLPSRIDPTTPNSFAGRRRSMLAAALLLTTPGVPMIFMGQESLALGTFANPPAPVDGTIPPEGAKIRAFYKDLIALRRNLGGQSGGLQGKGVTVLHRHDGNKVIAYMRQGPSGEDVIVVLNLRNKAYMRYDVGVPTGGAWRIRLDSDWKSYSDDFGGGQMGSVTPVAQLKDGQPFALPVKLGAYGAVVFTR